MRFLFAAKNSLTEEELKQAQQSVMVDGVATQVMTVLTSNTFLIALALALGLNTVYVGFLAAVPLLANVFQLLGAYILEKYKSRKAIVVTLSLVGRLTLLLTAFVPIFFVNNLGLVIIFTSLTINTISASISALAWSSWMRDLIPQKQLGVFFGKRIRYSMIGGILANLGAAFFVDWAKGVSPEMELLSYSVLFVVGFVFGVMGLIFLSHTHEPQMVAGPEINIWAKVKRPFQDQNFRRLLRFTTVWNFAVHTAIPFFTVYMLDRLGLSLSMIVVLAVVGELAFVLFVTLWGKFADQFSNKSVLNLTGVILIINFVIWTFTTFPEPHRYTVPILILVHILGGIAISGLNLSSGNIAMKLSPNNEAPMYLAIHNVVNSLFAGIAPILGGTLFFLVEDLRLELNFALSDPTRTLILPTLNIDSWDFYFLGASILGWIALYFLAFVEEEGEHVSRTTLANHLSGIVQRGTLRASLSSLQAVSSTPWIMHDIMKKQISKTKPKPKASDKKVSHPKSD